MNKQEETKYWVEQRMIAETRTKYAIERIKELDQLAEAEKPKRRHGDFGIVPEGGWKRIRLFRSTDPCLPDKPDSGENEDYNPYGICNTEDFIKFGNIFDLMEDWGKPFVRYEKKCQGGNTLVISQSFYVSDGIEFRINVGGCYATASIPEAEEIWRKLGHAIIELKRKKQGD